ncbi:interferon-induced very large GTPase 1-like [Lytechinus pictus]|uniref:interferon-induced very large GTPase 1-like n=1 Tax=Lytechinus pictus TaxID=7653 RepID=UPI0030B9B811
MSFSGAREEDISDMQNVFSSIDRNTHEEGSDMTASAGVTEQGDFSDIITSLGLNKYYPSKISLLDAMVIKKFIGHLKLVDLPWMFLHKVLMINFHARDQLLSEVKKSSRENKPDDGGDYDFEALLEMQNTRGIENNATRLNPLDALVAIFTCCDNFLKQTLAQKLFVCKLAIPFLYPLGSGGNVGMSLWALRTITIQWQSKQKDISETSVTERPFPVVTFVRLGRPPLSKSKLANAILRDDGHSTFFNHDCNNGTVPRRITDGLVECSWFIGVGKETEHLQNTAMFLNLRGDASLMKKQIKILQEISSVVFVTASPQDLARDPNTIAFQKILDTGAKVILLLISGSKKSMTLNMELQACLTAVGKDFLKGVPIILSNTMQGFQKNPNELKIEAREKLSEAIAWYAGITIEECARRAKNMGIVIDKYEDKDCLEGKALAENVVSHIEGEHIAECKALQLPMQGRRSIEYFKLRKDDRRKGKKSLFGHPQECRYIPINKKKMEHLREKQFELCKNGLTPFIEDFMSILNKQPDVVMYSLKWMSLILAEMSKANLSGLRKIYQTAWSHFQEASNEKEQSSVQHLKSRVDDAEIQLPSASLGLENIFRELGNIYEVRMGSDKIGKDTRAEVEYLPEITAKLLLKGIPLQLVDGDNSSVPIKWVSAVLGKLENIIAGKKMFVLSILGMQSSGKSTLLNTMFGLQFAVSGGRCTRGVYMQLIPVDGSADLPFDFVAVVDTEGLGAQKLGQPKDYRDNDLATLVIGLGNVTLINIKGENAAKSKNILDIAVHAFFEMNLVWKRIRDNRSCIFVHQNVPRANEEVMVYRNQELEESLDKITKETASSKNTEDIHNFSQIISFDAQTHVWYFPDLWHGNPHLAPANPGYSEKVGVVRLNVLGDIAKRQTTFLTPSELSFCLAGLWNGILAGDVVFGFRNSLENKAYNDMQSKCYTLEWQLQNEFKSWLHTAEIKLKICQTIDDLENSFRSLIVKLSEVLTEKGAKIKIPLKDFFENYKLREITIPWKEPKLKQLNFVIEHQHHDAKADLLSIKEGRQEEILQQEKWRKHEEYIMNKAVELAEIKGKEPTDYGLEHVKRRFDIMWMSLVHELAAMNPDKNIEMDVVMEDILCKIFHGHIHILMDELKLHPLNIPLEQTSLKGSITVDDVRNVEHISVTMDLFKKVSYVYGITNPVLQAKQETVKLTGRIMEEISSYLHNMSIHSVKFQVTSAKCVIENLVQTIDTYNINANVSRHCSFKITRKYVVKLAVHVSRHCVQVFNLMQLKYNNKYGLKAKIEDYKYTAWSLFKYKVKHSTEEVIAGDLLCTHLKGVVQEAVKKAIPIKCIDEVLRDFQMTKYYLIVKMMDDLATKEKIKKFKSYFQNPKERTLSWITKYTNEKMFSRHDVSGMSRYAELAKSHILRIKRCITKSVENATAEVGRHKDMQMALWIDKFCQGVSEEIAVPVSSLTCVSSRSVVNFNNLNRIILDTLDKTQASLEKAFSNETEHTVHWDGTPPPQQILDKIWGCPDVCPFCKEPCTDTTPDHNDLHGRNHACISQTNGNWWCGELSDSLIPHGIAECHQHMEFV